MPPQQAATPTPSLADKWQGLSPDERSEALSRMSDDQKQTLAETLGFNALTPNHPTNTTIGAAPSPLSLHGIGDKLYTARDWVVNNLPQVGGLAGGLLGTLGGVETGPGAVVPGAIGAAAGGGLGEDLKQFLNEKFHPEDAKMTPVQAAVGIGKQALSQGAQELAGQVAGRVMGTVARKFTPPDQILQKYPFLKTLTAVGEDTNPKAAQHLTAAATSNDVVGRSRNAGTALQAINNTMGDLEGEMMKLPPQQRTVEGFLGAVNNRKNAMNTESGAAMLPIAGSQTVPIGISDSIKNLIKSYMTQTQAGLTDRKYLLRRAAEFEKPWTYGQLDQLRSDLSAQLAKHNAQNPVARYTAQKGDLDLAIDNAVLDGLRDTVYPQMDQAAGKAPGYFADLKGRQSSLIQLQELLDKRIKDLKGSQALKDVTPPLSTENLSVSGHVGSLPRVGLYGLREAVFPQSTMTEANKHVAAAFPNVNSMPYRALFSGAAHIAGTQAPPKSKKTQQIGEQLESPDKWYNQAK